MNIYIKYHEYIEYTMNMIHVYTCHYDVYNNVYCILYSKQRIQKNQKTLRPIGCTLMQKLKKN